MRAPEHPASINLVPRRDRVPSRRLAETCGVPIEEYQEDERRFVRVYLPDVDPDQVRVTLRGSALKLCCERRIEYPDCDSTAPHHVMFDKVMSVPAGTTPDDVAAEYGDGVLLVSWPTDPSSAQHTFPLTRCELPVE